MPVIKINRSEEDMPSWCELRSVKRYQIRKGQTLDIETGHARSAIFVDRGSVIVNAEDKDTILKSGSVLSFERPGAESMTMNTGHFTVTFNQAPGYWMDKGTFYVLAGDWDWVKIASFRVDRVDEVVNIGDPTDYYRNTCFDNHYHEYDEYWVILRGSGKVQSEGAIYSVWPGDLVATKRAATIMTLRKPTSISNALVSAPVWAVA